MMPMSRIACPYWDNSIIFKERRFIAVPNIRQLKKIYSLATKNLRIIALILLGLIPSVALAYALMTHTHEVTIVSQPPIASFIILPDPQPDMGWEIEGAKIISGKTILTFNASSSIDPDGYINQYVWDFGDGNLGEGPVVTHIYINPGTYLVKLKVIDENGVSDTAFKELIVYSSPTAIISLKVREKSYEIGSNITVYIVVSNISNLYGWQAGLKFNSNVLECISFEKGEQLPTVNLNTTYLYDESLFQGGEGVSLWYPPKINNELGIVSPAACTLTGDDSVSGSGILAKITFKVLSIGDFDLRLTNVLLMTKENKEIPVIVNNNINFER